MMIKSRIVLCVGAVFFCSLAVVGCKKESNPASSEFKRYNYKNFHLSFIYQGDARGTEDFYVADYGKYEARYSHMQQMTPAGLRPYENGGITRLSDVYTIDFLEKKVAHLRMTSLDSLYSLTGSEVPTAQQFLETTMKDNYFTQAGNDTILGYKTTIWKQQDDALTLWVWNSMPMKRLTMLENGALETVVVAVDTNWVVDTMMFHVPTSGFELIEQKNGK